jgi:hypothetical protein
MLSPGDVRGHLEVPHRPSQLIDFTGVRSVLGPFLKSHTNLRLRTKLSFRASGPRNPMKITLRYARNGSERRGRYNNGYVEAVKLSDPERA